MKVYATRAVGGLSQHGPEGEATGATHIIRMCTRLRPPRQRPHMCTCDEMWLQRLRNFSSSRRATMAVATASEPWLDDDTLRLSRRANGWQSPPQARSGLRTGATWSRRRAPWLAMRAAPDPPLVVPPLHTTWTMAALSGAARPVNRGAARQCWWR